MACTNLTMSFFLKTFLRVGQSLALQRSVLCGVGNIVAKNGSGNIPSMYGPARMTYAGKMLPMTKWKGCAKYLTMGFFHHEPLALGHKFLHQRSVLSGLGCRLSSGCGATVPSKYGSTPLTYADKEMESEIDTFFCVIKPVQLPCTKIRDEKKMFSHLERKGIKFWKRNQRVGSNEKYFYPDGIIECKSFYIVIECDEKFHSTYKPSEEVERMMCIRKDLGKEVVFLRVGTKNGSILHEEQLKTVLYQVEKFSKMKKMKKSKVVYLHYPMGHKNITAAEQSLNDWDIEKVKTK